MKNKVKDFLKYIIPLLLTWYMLKITADHIYYEIKYQIENVLIEQNTEISYLIYLFLSVIDFLIIIIITLYKEDRLPIYEAQYKKIKVSDIVLGFVFGAYISIHIIIQYIFGAIYILKANISYVINIYILGIIIHSFVEEVFFRGYFLINTNKDYKNILLLISAMVFSIYHEGSVVNYIDQFIFGLALGLIVIKRHNIFMTTIIHAIKNIVLIVVFGAYGSEYSSLWRIEGNENVAIGLFDSGAIVVISSLVMLWMVLLILKKKYCIIGLKKNIFGGSYE